ncbi:MAG TPA: hypothetical protein VK470_00295 [Bacteroidota bacterium]|nr:hypothetical protein [Bacteroidota bacterium]
MTEYKYKLDFYYQQLLMYLVTMLVYSGVRGWMIDERFRDIFRDPILYIFAFFVAQSAVMLILNKIRGRKIIVTENEVIFHHKFGERFVPVSEIEWMHVGRERSVRTAGKMQVVTLKVRGRRRAYRIRIGRYERERELLIALEKLAAHAPKRTKRRFRLPR